MTTQTLTRCYRFPTVDFEPDLRLLVWRENNSNALEHTAHPDPSRPDTSLTVHESRLLEVLCYCAGEVISPESLYDKTFVQLDPYEDCHTNHYDLNTIFKSLTRKLERHGMMAIPIEAVPHYGFRVPLPDKACRKIHQTSSPSSDEPPAEPSEPDESPTEHIVKHSRLHKISVLLLALAGVAMIFASD